MTANIPKFASFRPKPKPDAELPEKRQERDEVEVPSKERARRNRPHSPPAKRRTEEGHLRSKTFFSDRRGDPEILRYASLNSHDIPTYRRYGYGCVLGLSIHQKIDREYSLDKKIYITPATRRQPERLLTSKHANKSSSRGLRLVQSALQPPDLDQDFIPLSNSKQHSNSDSSDADDPSSDYRGFDRGRGVDKSLDPDLQYEADTSIHGIDRATIRENSELLRKTRSHPENVEAWLDLIDHQEAMLKLDRPLAELSNSDRTHLALVRVPIYEEALKNIGKNEEGKLKLYMGLLREGQRAWDEKKINKRWQEVIAKHQSSADLWFMHLDFAQSNFPSFRYDDCNRRFWSCLDALDANPGGRTPELTLHVLLRLTTMIHEAGYQELALASWQAILEFSFMRPPQDDSTSPETLSLFEEFWESEVPRVGEHGANGWKSVSKDEAPSSGPPLLNKPDTYEPSIKLFGKHETEAIARLRYPGRTIDEAGWDDAFHVIFFSDLKTFLRRFPANTPKGLVLEAFLCFCGLPPPVHIRPDGPKWWSDPFLQHRFHLDRDFERNSNQFMQTFDNLSGGLPLGFQMTPEQLFRHDFSLGSIKIGPEFVRRLLKLISSGSAEVDWIGEYLLAFELQHFPQQLNKTAKQLIKANPSNLRLYNAYGLTESRCGNSTQASQVFSMALSMYSGVDDFSTSTSLELFSTWVWESLDRGEQAEALWRLTSPHGIITGRTTKDARPDNASVSRAHTNLSETIERSLLGQNYVSAVTSSSLLALLHYLANDYQPTEALATHQNLSSWFVSQKLSQSSYAELHAQAIARLLTYHITHAPIVKPALIRTALTPLISLFPENIILLALYAANESRFSLDDRVRIIMKQTTLQASDSTGMVGWAFAIHFEALRSEISGSTSHSVRALYKRATESACAHSPAFWKSYVQFELAQMNQERSRWGLGEGLSKHRTQAKRDEKIKEVEQRVKETFYAGLKNLPWCKDFIMVAFSDLREVFEDDELWKLYCVMQEKQLRLYVEFDKTESE